MTSSQESETVDNRIPSPWLAVATVLSVAVAVVLVLAVGVSWQKAAFLPLLVSGLLLIAWNTHWALCFAAFAITPVCFAMKLCRKPHMIICTSGQ